MKEKYTDKEILGAFLLVNDYRMLSNEELADVKVSITNLLKENESLKKQLEELSKKYLNAVADYEQEKFKVEELKRKVEKLKITKEIINKKD